MKFKSPALVALFCASSVQATEIFINEVHYDNDSSDVGEFIEVVGPESTDLTGYQVVLYNGKGGADYATLTITEQTINDGYRYASLSHSGIQNGSPDGMALIDTNGTVIQFLSYEGTMTATSGSAAGMTSQDIGVAETSSTPIGYSLQLAGTEGSQYADFTWQAAATATAGAANNGQTFIASEPDDGTDPGNTGGGDSDIISGSVCTNCPDVAKIKDASLFVDSTYYADVQAEVDANSSLETIKLVLSETISADHKNLSYGDVWTALTYTDEDPANNNNIILWYSNRSQAKSTNGSGAASSNGDNWNREHSWPKSHGFPSSSQEGYTDIHHLRPSDISINSKRGNLDFDNSDKPVTESPINRVDNDSFEPRDDIKGDVARMMFYMDTRYEGAGSDVTPDLQLVNRTTTTSEAKLGTLCTLIAWSNADQVDDAEQRRNSRIYELQGNRNPYVDHPEWITTLYPTDSCGATGGGTGGGTGGETGGGTDGETGGGTDGETGGDNTSSTLVFINEIHYDNASSDVGEAIEIAGLAGTDLTGMSVVLYNGKASQRRVYNTLSLSGVIPNESNGFGSMSFPAVGIQNGSPDGLALVNSEGTVLQFLSYEGSFEAVDGPAAGMTSTDIGVAEGSNTTAGQSLQLIGTGFKYQDFTWQEATIDSFGQVNEGQTFFAPAPFVNEIHYDNTGGDVDEAIEIAGLAGTDLSGMSIVLYNGKSSSRKVYSTTNLTGVLPDLDSGFGTLSFAISGIQNGGPDGLALVDSEGGVLQFLSYEGRFEGVDGPASGMTSTDIGVSEASSSAIGQSLQLSGSGHQYSDFTWQTSAISTFGDVNNAQNFGSATDGGTGGGTGGSTGDLGQCLDSATLISAIQGAGYISPLIGQTHVVEAVVTSSLPNLSGFFMQEEQADIDADPKTSEGIFVFYQGELPTEGSIVRVLGEVTEYYEKTQILAEQVSTACSTEFVTTTEFSLPFSDPIELEALEGMLVSASQELTVTDNYNLKSFGEVTLSYGRLYTPTNQFTPGSADAIALAAENALNKIILDDGVNGSNPEYIPYPAGGLTASNTLRNGDTVTGLIGPMDYSFDNYRIIPLSSPIIFSSNAREATPNIAEGNLKVASLNVLNYFITLDGNGKICGPNSGMDCRGADSVEEFERQKAKTVAAIIAMDADIVGLMEIENNGFSTGSAIDDLVSEINNQMGAGMYSIVDAGESVGTDAITVALIYKSSKVSPVGSLGILDSSNSIADTDGPLFKDTRNRPALVQAFALTENDEELVVSVNHFKSKGSSCGTGDDDTVTGQGNCNLTRSRAAQALTAFIASDYADKPVVILGDLNSYAKEDPIAQIESAGYTNLVNYFGGADAYSYAFRGLVGYLDHALANNKALAKVVDVTEWHINADEPLALDYNTENKSAAQLVDFYANDAYRMSDHDPVLITMQLDAPVTVAETSADVNQDGSVNFTDYFAILGMLGSTAGDASFDAIADYDEDGVISALDLQAWYQLFLGQ